MGRADMALKSFFGITEKKNLGVFHHLQIFMPKEMSALCTMNLNVSNDSELTIVAHFT